MLLCCGIGLLIAASACWTIACTFADTNEFNANDSSPTHAVVTLSEACAAEEDEAMLRRARAQPVITKSSPRCDKNKAALLCLGEGSL